MGKPLDHDSVAPIVLLEAHRYVDLAADEAIARIARVMEQCGAGKSVP
jgi:hypothetical protein